MRIVRGRCLPVLWLRPVLPRLILPVDVSRKRFFTDPLMFTLRKRTNCAHSDDGASAVRATTIDRFVAERRLSRVHVLVVQGVA